ncbi:hypothetical protein ACV242_004672 [Peribacillus simplex]
MNFVKKRAYLHDKEPVKALEQRVVELTKRMI